MINIKFRGKVKNTLEWVEGDYFRENHLGLIRHAIIRYERLKGCDVVYEVIPETVSQIICIIPNTSMYVDNSQELYEDDIFITKGSETKYVAKYDGYGEYYGISNEGDEYGAYTLRLSRHNIETQEIKIIGNIHDSPELLN